MPEESFNKAGDLGTRGWVWYSTIESFAASKISIFAIVETLLAMATWHDPANVNDARHEIQ